MPGTENRYLPEDHKSEQGSSPPWHISQRRPASEIQYHTMRNCDNQFWNTRQMHTAMMAIAPGGAPVFMNLHKTAAGIAFLEIVLLMLMVAICAEG